MVALGLLVSALALDVALIESAGFVMASAMLFSVAARAFGSRRPLRDVIAGLALGVIVHIAFTRGLGVTLPAGILG